MSGTGAAMGARQQHARSSIELLQPGYGGQGAGAQAMGGQALGGGPMAMQNRGGFDGGAGGRAGFMGQQVQQQQQQQGLGGRQQGPSPGLGQGFGAVSAQQLNFRGFDGSQGAAMGLAQGQGYAAPNAAQRTRGFDAVAEAAPRRFAPETGAYGSAPQVGPAAVVYCG